MSTNYPSEPIAASEMPEELSPEEQRRQMKDRFDAHNDASAAHRQTRRNIGQAKVDDDNRQRLANVPAPQPAPSTGENDEAAGE